MGKHVQPVFRRLALFGMWMPVVCLLLSTTASMWQQEVHAEQYSLAPNVASFLDDLKTMRNCGTAKGKMKVACVGRNATFLQAPAMMDDWDTFTQNFCYCDDECHLFRDCCADVADLTTSPSPRELVKGIPVEQWSCERLMINRTAPKVSQVSIHMVSACPATSSTPRYKCLPPTSDVAVDDSYMLDMPVMDRLSGVWYQNVFCAQCHGVVGNLAPMNRTLMCPDDIDNATKQMILGGKATYHPGQLRWDLGYDTCYLHVRPTRWSDQRPDAKQHVPGFYRPCVATVDTCPATSTDAVATTRCPQFAYYMMRDIHSVYKNHYCAACNGVPPSELFCWNPIAEGGYRTVASRLSPPSLSMLMDLRWDVRRTGKLISSSSVEVIYDDIFSQCIPLTESTNSYVVKDKHCVRAEAKPCVPPQVQLSLPKGDYAILPNRSLFVHTNAKYNRYDFDGDSYYVAEDGVVALCATPNDVADDLIYSDRAQSILTGICLTVSTVCLCLHIIAYSSIPQLNNLPGRNLRSLSWALLLAQLIFLFGVHPVFAVHRIVCVIIAVLIQYFYLAAFFWMSVMSYDIWRKFTSPTPESGHLGLHRRYSVYAWTSPALIVSLSVLLDGVNVLPPYARPNYGRGGVCWFGSPLGLGAFFAAPVVVVLVVNSVLFATTVRKIVVQKRESASYLRNQVRNELLEAKARISSRTGRPSEASKSPVSGTRDTVRLYLYVKLFTIMGLTWVIGFVAAFAGVPALWFPFILLNGLQGAFIFVMFDCKRSIGAAMWSRTLGGRYATPSFLRTPRRSGASDTGSSTNTTNTRLTSSRGARNSSSTASSVRDDADGETGHEHRQKLRVRMSNIVYQEEDADKATTCEETTKITIPSYG